MAWLKCRTATHRRHHNTRPSESMQSSRPAANTQQSWALLLGTHCRHSLDQRSCQAQPPAPARHSDTHDVALPSSLAPPPPPPNIHIFKASCKICLEEWWQAKAVADNEVELGAQDHLKIPPMSRCGIRVFHVRLVPAVGALCDVEGLPGPVLEALESTARGGINKYKLSSIRGSCPDTPNLP